MSSTSPQGGRHGLRAHPTALAGLRRRFWVEAVLAVAAGIALVLTLLWPEWIEELFGVEPDAGRGWAEWMVTAVLFVAAAGSSVLGALEWRRPRVVPV